MEKKMDAKTFLLIALGAAAVTGAAIGAALSVMRCREKRLAEDNAYDPEIIDGCVTWQNIDDEEEEQ